LAVSFLWEEGDAAEAGITDSVSHLPPTSGTYADNTFKPGASGFPGVGQSYTDPVFGTTITRLTDNGGKVGDSLDQSIRPFKGLQNYFPGWGMV
jgi:hypothetical protein